jgi:hypothetical protein
LATARDFTLVLPPRFAMAGEHTRMTVDVGKRDEGALDLAGPLS